MYTVLNYIRSFEGNHEADVAPGENEFDNPVLKYLKILCGKTQNSQIKYCSDSVRGK